jgi:acyl carrier protein
MTISSRTPEGDQNRCPVCGHHVRIEPSPGTRDAPCPRCGHLLWFSDDITARYPDLTAKWSEAKEVVLKMVEKRLGPPPENVRLALEGLSPDKFDTVKVALVRFMQLANLKSWDDLLPIIEAAKR